MSLTDLIAAYDELVLEGRAPNPEDYARAHPDQPALLPRLRELERLHHALERVLTRNDAAASIPEIPGFRVVRPLGRGGMGRVYLAEQLTPRRPCALKTIDAKEPAIVERFRREADLAARLSHPHVATVYAFGVADGQPYLATELVHGFSLAALLGAADIVSPDDPSTWFVETMRRLSEGEGQVSRPSIAAPVEPMLRIAVQLADALAHAHERGVVHRDVKPANVIVGIDGNAKLIDFGIAVATGETSGRLTSTGTFVGSHDYAAPEQLRGEPEGVGSWSDTYALGATLFEMLTQRTPFEAATYADRLRTADQPPPHGPRFYNPRVPAALDALVRRALEPDPNRRYADGEAMAAAIRACPTAPSLLPRWPAVSLVRFLPSAGSLILTGAALALAAVLAIRWTDAAEENQRLRARHEAESFVLSQALLDSALRAHGPALATCRTRDTTPSVEEAHLTAELRIEGGMVKQVRVVHSTPELGSSTRACVTAVIARLDLSAVGHLRPLDIAVDVLIPPAP